MLKPITLTIILLYLVIMFGLIYLFDGLSIATVVSILIGGACITIPARDLERRVAADRRLRLLLRSLDADDISILRQLVEARLIDAAVYLTNHPWTNHEKLDAFVHAIANDPAKDLIIAPLMQESQMARMAYFMRALP